MSAREHSARVTVRLDPGVNDPQGNAVADSLRAIGFGEVRGVRVGRVIDLVVEAESADVARARVDEMCQALLANPVIETWDVDISAEATDIAPDGPD